MSTHMYVDFLSFHYIWIISSLLNVDQHFFVYLLQSSPWDRYSIFNCIYPCPLWMDMDICISIRVDLQAINRIRTRNVELLMLLGSFSFVLSPHQRSGSRVWGRELFTFLQTNKTEWCSPTVLSSPKIVTWFDKSLQINKDYKNLCELSTLK